MVATIPVKPSLKTLVTADDLLTLPNGEGQRYELIQGELHTMTPAGGEHGRLHLKLGAMILNCVRRHRLGEVFGAETGFRIGRDPDTVRAPDVAFLRTERWAAQERPDAFVEGPPDLAVEIVSPWDKHDEVHEKALAWLEAGAQLVWIVQPRSRTLTVYWPDRSSRVLGVNDTVDGGEVIPQLTLQVRDIFEYASF